MFNLFRLLVSLPCCCGCDRDAHQHYRRGRECSLCFCPKYRRAWLAITARKRSTA